MSSVPRVWEEDGGDLKTKPDHRLPGRTVDALLHEGKVDEARIELETILSAGINSSPGSSVTEAWLEKMVARLKADSGHGSR